MSTGTEDRSPFDARLEGVPFTDVNAPKEAPTTPLTREAVVHLRAAGQEIDEGCATLAALVNLVRRRIQPPAEVDVVLGFEEAYDLARTLEAVEEIAHAKVVEPVFERGRGERPHGGDASGNISGSDGGGSDLPRGIDALTGEDVQAIVLLRAAAGLASEGVLGDGEDRTPTSVRRIWYRLLKDADPAVDHLMDLIGMERGEDARARTGEMLEKLGEEVGA